MLEARHLVKRFFGTAVVSDVSFEVRAGEVVGYLGPNGSGNSTTAKMLTGLVETSAGAVLFDGQDIALDLAGQSLLLASVLSGLAAAVTTPPASGW